MEKTNTLDEFRVHWTHVSMEKQKPKSELDEYLLSQMCSEAAKGIHQQCSSEYWEECEQPRVTQIHKLTAEQRKNIPGDNLNCERNLAKFGALAAVSASKSNKIFKAKRIRDDMLFSVNMTNEEDIKLSSEKIFKELNSME